MEHVLGWVSTYGAIALYFLLMLGIVGLPVPDETLMVFSGYLIYSGRLHPAATFAGAFLGSITGITISYGLGRTFGHAVIVRYGKRFYVTPERLEVAHSWFRRIGHWFLFVGYFIPGVRHFTAIVAGTSELEAVDFGLYAYAGAFVWVSTFLGLGYFLGEQWERAWVEIHTHLQQVGFAALALILAGGAIWWWRRRT